MLLSRRHFCAAAATLAASRLLTEPRPLRAQELHPPPSTSRPDVALIDRNRILTAADHFLTEAPDPLTAHRAPNATGSPNEFVSELDDPANTEPAFTAHQDALLRFTLAVPALTAAFLITHTSEPDRARRYADLAALHLRAWFVTPGTRMDPSLNLAGSTAHTTGHPDGIAEASAVAEIAQCIPFLARAEALPPADLTSHPRLVRRHP